MVWGARVLRSEPVDIGDSAHADDGEEGDRQHTRGIASAPGAALGLGVVMATLQLGQHARRRHLATVGRDGGIACDGAGKSGLV